MNTTILIKTNKELKQKVQDLAQELGLSVTDVVNASFRQFLINQGINISKLPTETLDAYTNKKDILMAYKDSFSDL
jgi:antitoxin component of RelBE/YafQ-DinJ toxin-antitoxin module